MLGPEGDWVGRPALVAGVAATGIGVRLVTISRQVEERQAPELIRCSLVMSSGWPKRSEAVEEVLRVHGRSMWNAELSQQASAPPSDPSASGPQPLSCRPVQTCNCLI